ncbi:polyphosphate polymerase domain-containing protein [Terrisporobacter othiniensis]|nr:polyphosphate polymerase domain-containing protein [Terrisporobacter othiniensis]
MTQIENHHMENKKESKSTIAVSRKEIKYLVSLKDRLYLLSCLDKLLTPDAYGGYNGYSVRSLYFDSISNIDYIEKVTKADAIEIINGNYEVLLKYDTDISEYAYNLMTTNHYRPVSLVEYDRRAYTHKCFNTRITLDNNLRYTDFDYDLFSDNVNFKQALDKDKTILEVKYDRFLFAQIQDILSNCDLLGKPPSKYETSRQLLKQYYY